jgi:hypothetical protein
MNGPVLGPASGLPELPKGRPCLGDWSVKGVSMYAKCECGAERIVPTYSLIQKLGAGKTIRDQDLPDIAKRLRCGTCKAKGKVSVRVVVG